MTELPERFLSKVVVDAATGCWQWQATIAHNGYGHFSIGGRRGGMVKAHRFAYESLVGPIPEGLELDHLCRNRACVNPDHLEAITRRENLLRGDTIPASNAAKTHCPKGHPYEGTNLALLPRGWRVCRTCRNESVRRTRDRRRAA